MFLLHTRNAHSIHTIFWRTCREMFEVMGMLAGLAFVGLYFHGSLGGTHLLFVAYFFVMVAVAIRYHTFTAYSTALLVAVSYGLLLWWYAPAHVSLDLAHTLVEPALLFVGGVVTSDILRNQRRRYQQAEDARLQHEKDLQDSRQSYSQALNINGELAQKIADHTTTLASISDRIRRLWSLDTQHLYPSLLDVVQHALEAHTCALYCADRGQLRLCASYPQQTSHAALLNDQDPLIRRVMQQQAVYTVRDILADGEVIPFDMPLMAGPLVDDRGHLLGIIVIDQMPFLKFAPDGVRLFSVVLEMAALALQSRSSMQAAAIPQDVSGLTVPDPVTPLPEVLIAQDRPMSNTDADMLIAKNNLLQHQQRPRISKRLRLLAA